MDEKIKATLAAFEQRMVERIDRLVEAFAAMLQSGPGDAPRPRGKLPAAWRVVEGGNR